MFEALVLNASPIISLARAGHLDVVLRITREALVPEGVVREVLAGPQADPARKAIEGGWGTVVTRVEVPETVLEWGLGAGESSVIAVALERRCLAVLDDAEGRACARSLGVALTGTLGLVIGARKAGVVPSAGAVLRDIVRAGLYLDEALVRAVLRSIVGEDWPD